MKPNPPDGATPLDPNEINGLLLPHITTREELNYWEQRNINNAENWAFAHRQPNLLSQSFACRLPKKMFVDVWKWAGRFRTTQKNIGIVPRLIATELEQLLGDVKHGSTLLHIRPMRYRPGSITVQCKSIPFQTAMAATPGSWLTCSWCSS